jgi:hypothetical protein
MTVHLIQVEAGLHDAFGENPHEEGADMDALRLSLQQALLFGVDLNQQFSLW